MPSPRPLSSEELRILKAAAEGRLVLIGHRWAIIGAARPRPACRDHLQRRGLIELAWHDDSMLMATPAGLAVLKAEEAKDA